MRVQSLIFQSASLIAGFVLVPLMIMHQPCLAQVTTADLEGKIIDEQGQPLPNVNIIVRNQETGIVRGAASAPNGRYHLSGVIGGILTNIMNDPEKWCKRNRRA